MMTLEQLCIATGATPAVAKNWLAPLQAAMERFGDILTAANKAAFLANIGHETGGLTAVAENLDYTPEAIISTFNRKVQRFTPAQAQQYGRTGAHRANQEMIANLAYANRYGNGGPDTGHGWLYRGRGAGQLTFLNNYLACGKALGLDLVANPVWVERPDIGALAFAWFWNRGNPTGESLSLLVDAGDVDGARRKVNGGENGIVECAELFVDGLGAFA
jgi:putative chitinase